MRMIGIRPSGQVQGRRPALLVLVYGIFLVLVGTTASALVGITSVNLKNATLNTVVSRDRSLVALFVNDNLRRSDLRAGGPAAARADELEAKLEALTREDEILRVEIRSTDGVVLLSSQPGLRGETPPASAGMAAALAGDPSAELISGAALTDPAGAPVDAKDVVQEFLPLMSENGDTLAAVALWRDAALVLASLDAALRDILVLTIVAAALLAIVLYGVFRAAGARIARQHTQLLDAERRDPLTGLLNHGAVVVLLAEALEAARPASGQIAVALVDVDNFRLFNDAHGHDAADEVLLRVAELVEREAAAGCEVARYGPDEFLLVRREAGVDEMQTAVSRLRDGLAEVSVQFGDSERLPVSVSAGICASPDHATSVTDLLSAAAIAVGEAKASGGDGVRIARSGEDERVTSGSFDVLQGLVIAVDTKDRYTKRHSEDVARYAAFLASRLGLEDELQRTIKLAGLLHDVGKIGIPDTLLRKPSKLTAEEFEIFKQHVALGDAIVRDVPNVEQVRAAIRNHHERWDGRGYLEGLEGQEIPLIGRILAVADAFSAMTTTRPYRKALPIEEALKRLGDAAGTQLQEELVVAFIEGIETAPDAPLPGEETPSLWLPAQQVA
jgi:diguanylate cyclase (GGDEF)-like protein/putative nucleotidyltransferase with HDIG domain